MTGKHIEHIPSGDESHDRLQIPTSHPGRGFALQPIGLSNLLHVTYIPSIPWTLNFHCQKKNLPIQHHPTHPHPYNPQLTSKGTAAASLTPVDAPLASASAMALFETSPDHAGCPGGGAGGGSPASSLLEASTADKPGEVVHGRGFKRWLCFGWQMMLNCWLRRGPTR